MFKQIGGIGVALFVIVSAVNAIFGNKSASKSIETQMVEAAEKANLTLPRTVDDDTRLDKVEAGPGKIFTYLYTLPNKVAADVDSQQLHAGLLALAKTRLCTNPSTRKMIQNAVTLQLVYRDKNGVEVTRVSLSQSDCP